MKQIQKNRPRKTKYSDEPLGRLRIIENFLPPPSELVLKEDGIKVTISLSKRSVAFFKASAAKSNIPYQRMIRSLLDSYAEKHESTTRSSARTSRRR
jgi:predicted DNA binding CopG/RHH family protein